MQEELTKIYRRAQREIKAKLKNWQEKYQKDAAKLQEKLQSGQITQDEYRDAMNRLAFRGKLWDQKLDQVTGVLANANAEALQIINDEKMGVFADNANWQSYQITKDTGMALNFSVYDQDAVGNLLKNEPQLLPKKKLDTAKDKAWNQRKIAGAVAQGIIQGESIPKLAARIAADTASINGDAMIRYARTAMTGAQNAGRLHTLQRAEAMGIKCKKCWLATLDGRTRDSHRDMDGVKVGINEKFHTPLGSEMLYPGDVAGKPVDVWNCRCTMIYEYDGYEGQQAERIAYIEGVDENGKRYRKTQLIKDMTYRQWEQWKQSAQDQQQEPKSALESKIQKAVHAVRPKKAQFTPAESREEAETYAGRFLGYNGKVSYKGIELEYANKCNQVLADIHETFDVGGLQGIQAMNTREKLWKTSTAEAAYRWGSGDLFINPRYYKSPAAFAEHKKEIDSLMETVMKGGQALIDSGSATGRKKDYIEALLRTGRQCVSQSYDFVEGTFVHECGHMMDDKIVRRELIQAFGGSNVRYGDLLAESRAKYGGQISGYAISDNQEYIAESFTAWWFGEGEKCDPVIVDVFERLVKK